MTGFLDDLPELAGLPAPRPAKPKRAGPVKCVQWARVRCPACGSAKCPAYDVHQKPLRYHRCADCGWNFSSYETNYRSDDDG